MCIFLLTSSGMANYQTLLSLTGHGKHITCLKYLCSRWFFWFDIPANMHFWLLLRCGFGIPMYGSSSVCFAPRMRGIHLGNLASSKHTCVSQKYLPCYKLEALLWISFKSNVKQCRVIMRVPLPWLIFWSPVSNPNLFLLMISFHLPSYRITSNELLGKLRWNVYMWLRNVALWLQLIVLVKKLSTYTP